jgi:hypothetical protein
VGRAVAPTRYHQEALASAPRWRMQCRPRCLPQRPRAVRSNLPAAGKKEKERQRKERQRQRRMEEAREALQAAMEAMALGARCASHLCC